MLICVKRLNKCGSGSAMTSAVEYLKNAWTKICTAAQSLQKAANTGFIPTCLQKKDRENINQKELEDFRLIANIYAKFTDKEIDLELADEILVEICHGKKV